jgi:hypothetical protein
MDSNEEEGIRHSTLTRRRVDLWRWRGRRTRGGGAARRARGGVTPARSWWRGEARCGGYGRRLVGLELGQIQRGEAAPATAGVGRDREESSGSRRLGKGRRGRPMVCWCGGACVSGGPWALDSLGPHLDNSGLLAHIAS